MLTYSPYIVHFCGHGEGEAGIVLEDNNGKMQLMSTEALAQLFKLFSDSVECVVLNACYTEIQAAAIVKYIPYVIGMSQAVSDTAALEFAVAFYKALAAGKSIEFACKLGINSIFSHGLPENLTPVLKHRQKKIYKKTRST